MVAVVVVLRAVAIMVVIMAVEVVAMAQLRLLVDPRPYAAYGSRGTLAATEKYQTFNRSLPEVDKAFDRASRWVSSSSVVWAEVNWKCLSFFST